MSKPKKYVVGRVGKAPILTRIEVLTQGLMRDPDEVKASFSIKTDEKGRGVYLKIPLLEKGAFVLEYEGEVITSKEASHREKLYASNGEGCFIMEFRFNGTKMAIDATRNFGSYTRLLNHSRHPNIKFHSPIVVDLNGSQKPRIGAYALRDITRGEEIVFDYGVQDKAIPWLKNRQVGYADVSEDEYEEESVEKDEESCSSEDEENCLCLRYTTARASRLNGEDSRMAFNYQESSGSTSSSFDSGRDSSSRSKHSPVMRSDSQSTSSQKYSFKHPMNSVCRWEIRRTQYAKRKYEVYFSPIAQPQKILKCVEPKRKYRKAESSGSIVCLSDESSPSQISLSTGDPKELLDIPEVSSQAKVLSWQTNSCSDIKIVGVQSLCDYPELTHQLPYPVASQSCQPVVSLERLENPAVMKVRELESGSVLPVPSSTNYTETSALPQSHLSWNMQSEAQLSSSQSFTSNHLAPTSPPIQQALHTTGSSETGLSKQAQEHESPLTISDSEDQPLLGTALQTERQRSRPIKPHSPLYFSPLKTNFHQNGKIFSNKDTSTSQNIQLSLSNKPSKSLTQIPQSQENYIHRQAPIDVQQNCHTKSRPKITNTSPFQENCRSENRQTLFCSHTSNSIQPVQLVISDDEDDQQQQSKLQGKNSRTTSVLHQSKPQGQIVLDTSSDSDVEEISPSQAPAHSANKLITMEHARHKSSALKVAVIQPFQSEIVNNNEYRSSEVLTFAEKDYLCKIFDRSSFSRNVSKQVINDKIYRHWNFFRSILERGISIEQIRAAVKQTCLEKYKRSRQRRDV